MSDYNISFGDATIETKGGVSDEEYQQAMRAIQMDKDRPGSVPIGDIRIFVKDIDRYRSQKSQSAGSNLSDKHEQPIDTSIRYVKPPLARPPETIVDLDQPPEEVAAAKARREKFMAENYTNRTPGVPSVNMTGRKDVPPPSFEPPETPATGVMDRLARAKDSLPSAFGGKVQHIYEPSLLEFQNTMRPYYGDAVDKMGKGATEFAQYADMRWKEVYDKARAQGIPVVRQAFSPNTPGNVAAGIAGGAGAALAGADKMFTLGLGGRAYDKLEETGRQISSLGGAVAPDLDPAPSRKAALDAYPISGGFGELGAALHPKSLVARAGRLIGAGGRALLGGAAGGVAGRIGVGALEGAGASAATSAGLDAVESIDNPNMTAGQIGERAKIAALIGLPLGAVGGAIGAHGANLQEGPLGAAGPGVRSSIRSGVRLNDSSEGRAMANIIERAKAEPGSPKASELMLNELERPLVNHALESRLAAEASIGADKAAAHAANPGQMPTSTLLKAATKSHAAAMDDGGRELAFQANLPKLRAQIANLADVKPVPLGEDVPGAILVSEAKRQGYDVSKALAEDAVEVVIRPRLVSLEKLDEVISGLDQMQKAGTRTAEPLPGYRDMAKAARDMRDRFSKEYSAQQGGAGRGLHDEARRFKLSGIPDEIKPQGLDADQHRAFVGAMSNYGEPGADAVARNRAIHETAGLAGVGKELERSQQMRAFEKLQEEARAGNAPSLFRPLKVGTSTPVRLRADALARKLQFERLGNLGSLSSDEGPVAIGRRAGEAFQGASQATIDMISRMLNMGSPLQ